MVNTVPNAADDEKPASRPVNSVAAFCSHGTRDHWQAACPSSIASLRSGIVGDKPRQDNRHFGRHTQHGQGCGCHDSTEGRPSLPAKRWRIAAAIATVDDNVAIAMNASTRGTST